MDYSSYFSAPPPHQYYMGLPPTPSYDSSSDKLNLQSHLDPATFLQYDAFSFSSLPSGSPPAQHHHSHSTVPPALHTVGSVDSGIHLDIDTQHASRARHHHTQPSPIHASLSTSGGRGLGARAGAGAGPSAYTNNVNNSNHHSSSDDAAAAAASPPPPQHAVIPTSPTSRTRSSSEEKDGNALGSTVGLTPAQSRRKAQNRAAQRAFRERKERHVRELEDKLRSLETSTHSLQSDNERLKLLLQRAKTENEILRATRSSRPGSPGSGSGGSVGDGSCMEIDVDKDAYTTVSAAGGGGGSGYGAPSSSSGTRGSSSGSPSGGSSGQRASHSRGGGSRTTMHLLGASQTWDLIQSHPLVRSGAVEVADVCERLRTAARCDGQGPVFEEAVIYKVIEEESSRGGGDALI